MGSRKSLAIGLAAVICAVSQTRAQEVRQLPVSEYVDRMKAGWIGQMAGVGWGGPTEFHYRGAVIPEDKMPAWKPELINQFQQDDIYVEMTFLRTLEEHGLDVPIRQAGIDFANSGYNLWHANRAGRDNLRLGIAPPDSGHPGFNRHADDIDYQIEADFSGLIAPGMPNTVIALGDKFGRLMNYGDGLYGGQFVGGMYAEAFFETDMARIVRRGLACIPADSQYAECIRDVLAWWKQHPDDWQATWRLIDEKYQRNLDYRRFSCDKGAFNIDAKLNGAYIVVGLLYGEGDIDKTIVISTRCGQDSDCNPSNAAGILFTTIGYAALPQRFKTELEPEERFSHTPYDFPTLVSVCEKLARQAVVAADGRVEKGAAGSEVFVIPIRKPQPGPLEQCWEPGPIADSRFTESEMAAIRPEVVDTLALALKRHWPGWTVHDCGEDMDPGLREEWNGRKNVLVTHPLNREVGCVLRRTVAVPESRRSALRIVTGHDPRGDWRLLVRVNGKAVRQMTVGPKTASEGWLELDLDMTSYGGTKVLLELVNQPNGWAWEAAYWAELAIVEK